MFADYYYYYYYYYYYNGIYMNSEVSGPILLSNVSCNGSEFRLLDCLYEAPDRYCNHSLDAVIFCQTCKYLVSTNVNTGVSLSESLYTKSSATTIYS